MSETNATRAAEIMSGLQIDERLPMANANKLHTRITAALDEAEARGREARAEAPKLTLAERPQLVADGKAFADNGDDLERLTRIENAERAVIEAAENWHLAHIGEFAGTRAALHDACAVLVRARYGAPDNA